MPVKVTRYDRDVELFLVRHADAVDDARLSDDAHRHLTESGRAQARALGERLRWHDCTPTLVLTSPLVRAVQTAELVLAALGLDAPCSVEAAPALAPGTRPSVAVAAISALAADASVLVVGHEPLLCAIASTLAGSAVSAIARAEAVRILDGRVRWRFAWNAEAASPARGA
jgi:phosphohistidine phosphatase